ncbi:protein-arginine deiminase type-4 [Sorex araneus]|uniref:protein-arginine deiminase type-4 n=1 Tax=Sorex araneus TaxID=42254 RepID=UPI0024337FA0|nr:protein-arginine deiminase type-4 [Sorex araneus]
MAQGTRVHLSLEHPTHAVCVLDTETQLDVCSAAPEGCTSFGLSTPPGVLVHVAHGPPTKKNPTGSSKWPLDPGLEVSLRMKTASRSTGDQKIRVSYYRPRTAPVHALLYVTGVEISLIADITRTGKAKPTAIRKDQGTWTWGPRGQGAILLVNCDRDSLECATMDSEDDQVFGSKDLQDMSLVTLRTNTPRDFFSGHQLVLHVATSEMDKVRVFHANRGKQKQSRLKTVLGPRQPAHTLDLPGGRHSTDFYVEGLAFPDAHFPGLISLSVSLLDSSRPDFPKAPLYQKSVLFRVTPWIMTPNTQPPQEVYVCSTLENKDFLKSLAALAEKAQCKLTVCPMEQNKEDRWMQDEMEIGYIQAPHQTLPVVFDSPRNRGLKEFPKLVLGPDFGYVTRGPQKGKTTDLDSFGNLEVSPPVTVAGKRYPLGRVLIGSSLYPSAGSQEMHQSLRDFLEAQQVQRPVTLYSDWLCVGHIDEFLSFVPAPDKGFRLLLASPSACYQLFREQMLQGHGEAVLLAGKKTKQQRIKDILSNKKLREHNSYVESCIDWNREVLKRELGLTERDIVDIPQLFTLQRGDAGRPLKAEAFFPNMVNMLVLGQHLGIPKPFGPVINGRCCLEEKVRALLEPLGLHCTFIDDYLSYHIRHGDVHCGTNVRRQPLPFKWWHMEP